jgi:hypothetical protein
MAAGGLRGQLITATFAQAHLHTVTGAGAPPPHAVRALDVWSDRRQSALGPASSPRAICDVAVIPLLKILGFEIRGRSDAASNTILEAGAFSSVALPVVVTSWDTPLDAAWRESVLHGVRADARWGICSNGALLRIVDTHRTWGRYYIEFDLALIADDAVAQTALWGLVRAEAMNADPPLLHRAAELSASYGLTVCRALGDGVLTALRVVFAELAAAQRNGPPQVSFEQSLTILYRILFLLFAEARGLVPIWHPVYRDRYTINAILTTLLSGGRYRGVWSTIVAISRLAHSGCRAGDLTVTPFNGRLFSPSSSTVFDRKRIGDEVLREAVLAVGTTTAPGGGRARISYGELDVEQLGAVYEHVLEYEPAIDEGTSLRRTRDVRRSTGTFYTPRAVTAYLVRETLEPLVRNQTTEDILRLRVLDPAMGSGAFLVAACRYLSNAAQESLIREGHWHRSDVTAADRAGLRRQIAQRCLFGVDVNPMAVQLARLSLWLATLAADKPLTFLDHHLVAGDSLVGATLDDVLRQPTGRRHRQRRPVDLPLFDRADVSPALADAIRARERMAREPDDTAAIVAAKEKALAALNAPESALRRWSHVLDLWCAGWFWEEGPPPNSAVFGELCGRLLQRGAVLPDRVTQDLLDDSAAIAGRHRFLHWPIVFPEVFRDDEGSGAGFDAVIGNPPWDMVKGDSGDTDVRAGRRREARHLVDFIREAGIYRVEARAHLNRYQLFVERAIQLTKPGGRIGLVLPSGVVTDTGTAPLRRHLFDRARVDSIVGLDNRVGIFPIHRSLRFVLLSATAGGTTVSVPCRFGVTDTEALERPQQAQVTITRALLSRLSGSDDLGIPEITSEQDLRIVSDIGARCSWLCAPNGWHVEFGRELNATDDLGHFRPFTGRADARPVMEGKQIEPFRTTIAGCRYELNDDTVSRRVPRRARLAYRDIASATNRLTLIAAVVPARAVTTHTLFCLKTRLALQAQHVLCALLNSFVANYLIRLRVNTHVTVALVSRLPVPVIDPRMPAFAKLAALSRALRTGTTSVEQMPEYAESQALCARLYGLSEADFEHILGTFPLIPQEVKDRALQRFVRLGDH